MIIALALVTIAGIALTVYALALINKSDYEEKRQIKDSQDKEQKIAEMQNQINFFKEDLEKTKGEYTDLQKEVESGKREAELAKTKELASREELTKLRDWHEKDQAELEKIKKDSSTLKREFINKEKELAKEFSENVKLNTKLRESEAKVQSLEKESREKTGEIGSLKKQVEKYVQELKKQTDTIT